MIPWLLAELADAAVGFAFGVAIRKVAQVTAASLAVTWAVSAANPPPQPSPHDLTPGEIIQKQLNP